LDAAAPRAPASVASSFAASSRRLAEKAASSTTELLDLLMANVLPQADVDLQSISFPV
jgi:hypothetical protein